VYVRGEIWVREGGSFASQRSAGVGVELIPMQRVVTLVNYRVTPGRRKSTSGEAAKGGEFGDKTKNRAGKKRARGSEETIV